MRLLDDLPCPPPPRPAPGSALRRTPWPGELPVLSELARCATSGEGRQRFRVAALRTLRRGLPFAFGFVAAPPGPRVEVAALGATPPLVRLLTRHARSTWAELLSLRARATEAILQLAGPAAETPLLRLLRLDRPVSSLCIGWLGDDAAAVVLGRVEPPGFRSTELELLRLALPVLTLADAHASDLADTLGARLSRREQEIFEYLQRGYSNRQIALVLGTSPLTVRNQLGRLFRKVGVASRAELVGLAMARTRAPSSLSPAGSAGETPPGSRRGSGGTPG